MLMIEEFQHMLNSNRNPSVSTKLRNAEDQLILSTAPQQFPSQFCTLMDSLSRSPRGPEVHVLCTWKHQRDTTARA